VHLIYRGHDLDLSGSRDVINDVIIRRSGVMFSEVSRLSVYVVGLKVDSK